MRVCFQVFFGVFEDAQKQGYYTIPMGPLHCLECTLAPSLHQYQGTFWEKGRTMEEFWLVSEGDTNHCPAL